MRHCGLDEQEGRADVDVIDGVPGVEVYVCDAGMDDSGAMVVDDDVDRVGTKSLQSLHAPIISACICIVECLSLKYTSLTSFVPKSCDVASACTATAFTPTLLTFSTTSCALAAELL